MNMESITLNKKQVWQIGLARVLRKPLVIQLRQSEDRALEILKREHAFDVGGVVHCFSGSLDFAREVLDLGFTNKIKKHLAFVPLIFQSGRDARNSSHSPGRRADQ
jgi:Tat protein secretion system quality control protein TatD with DNase activity